MRIITGMHRSGTSMITHLLYELKGDLGPQEGLLAADRWNRKGYFENRDIFLLNDQILLGRYAASLSRIPPSERTITQRVLRRLTRFGYGLLLAFPRLIRVRARKYAGRIAASGRQFSGIYVKDPRFSLLTGAWARHADVERILYCYRHPYEVVHSIHRRDAVPKMMAYLLWAFHVRRFLEDYQTVPTVFINYNALFDASHRWDEMARLYQFLERPFDRSEAEAALSHVLDQGLKNNTYTGQAVPTYIHRVYEQLQHVHDRQGQTLDEQGVSMPHIDDLI